eukprot:2182412-Lingulodinium_polyedra.AAC.1
MSVCVRVCVFVSVHAHSHARAESQAVKELVDAARLDGEGDAADEPPKQQRDCEAAGGEAVGRGCVE